MYLRNSLYYSSFLRIIIQDYLELALITFIVFKSMLHFSTFQEMINTIAAVLVLMFLLFLPLILFIFLTRNKDLLHQDDFT